jgi:hypothetical protein
MTHYIPVISNVMRKYWKSYNAQIFPGMHYIIVHSSFRRKPSCLLDTTPFTRLKPKTLSHQGLSIGSTILFLHLMHLKKVIWPTFPPPSKSTFPLNRASSKKSSLELLALLRKSPHTKPSSRNIGISSLGHTQRCMASDPSIVEHRIDAWPDITPVRQKQRPLHPSKATAIKAEIDKLRTVGFIYPIAYTSWVSNPIPVDKKQGSIRICTNFRDLNNACPKDNFPMPFIDQIIDDYTDHKALSFMDGFSGYNQIQIHPVDQYKTTFITPWGTFSYRVMPFGLKNAGATFQWAMTYIFHDLVAIILAYLDDLTTRSKKRTQHLDDLRVIFQRCHQYNICLNPLKCVLCVTAGRLLGFIVSQSGITVDPLKVQAITEIPPPQNLRQLQSLQGKANFLRRFVSDYAICAHGFLHLLFHDIPFHWDDYAQQSFDDLKAALSNTPLISAPDYNHDYILYVSASAVSVSDVLV